jgi:hypothetical protein
MRAEVSDGGLDDSLSGPEALERYWARPDEDDDERYEVEEEAAAVGMAEPEPLGGFLASVPAP